MYVLKDFRNFLLTKNTPVYIQVKDPTNACIKIVKKHLPK